jgi:tetratricopeptide (TPR) repeat protein
MPPDEADPPGLAKAIERYHDRAYREAATLLEGVLRAHPQHVTALRVLGLCHVRQGAVAAGMPLLERARAIAPGDPAVLMAHGIGLQAAGLPGDAARIFRQCAPLLPFDPAPLLNLSIALLAVGDATGALSAARRAKLRDPRRAEAYYVLGLAERARGELARAADALTQATRLQTDFSEAWVDLGVVRYLQGHLEEAQRATRQALTTDPDNRAASVNLALFRTVTEQSEAPLEALLARDPTHAEVRFNLAVGLVADDREADALALLDGHRPVDPDLAVRWRLQQSSILLDLGRCDEAAAVLEGIDTTSPALAPQMALRRVHLALAAGDVAAARAQAEAMQRMLVDPPRGIGDLWMASWFDLARFWRGQNEVDRDFLCCTEGHRLLRRLQPFSRPDAAAFFAASRDCYPAERLASGPVAGNRDQAPVFIVGMPRSGTTLTEQILAAHRDVHGGGERNALVGSFATLCGDPRSAASVRRAAALGTEELDAAAQAYLAELHALAPGTKVITDKMPGNFRLLGFAATMLPGSRIVYCERDPRDIGLSIFQHPFFGYHPYAHDLGDLGWFIGQCRRMMAHWQDVLPGRILVVRLADWVADFDATLRRVLAFLDLPDDAACARFYESDRRVMTVSRRQVRAPLNSDGLNRWQPYARYLQPLIAELGSDHEFLARIATEASP